MQTVTAHGARIPLIGLGTWDLRGRVCKGMVEQALMAGYRHVDTAEMYDNESSVGDGLRASKVGREQVFVTTKIWPSNFKPKELIRAAEAGLKRLKLADVDLMLLHWPNPQVPLADTLGALCEVKRKGLTRHIGVSNFTVALLDEANRLSSEPLVCNQIEVHTYLDQSKVVAACRRHGMAVVAYSPIARGRTTDDAALQGIGARYGKTGAQVCLRWLIQQDIVAIPRTSKTARLAENIDVFDFELSIDEMKTIGGLAHRDGRIIDYAYSGTPQWD